MPRRVDRRSLAVLAVAVTTLGALWLAAPASSFCSSFHGDRAGYGPIWQGIFCYYAEIPDDNTKADWTVPDGITEAGFFLEGADDPVGGRGGRVKATLPVTPGEILTLAMGSDGAASSVSREGVPLFVAAGGNGLEPNYLAPGAGNPVVEAAGQPNPPYPQNGIISIGWWECCGGFGDVEYPELTDRGGHNGWVRPPAGKCVVPGLRGKRPAAARRALAAAHCTVGSVGRRPAKRGMWGRVVAQSRHPELVLPEGGAVDLTVGRR